MALNFYEKMEGFTSFDQVFDAKHYHKVPKGWFVVFSDIKQSTYAIEHGKYKDVNMVGAACISAMINVCNSITIPY